MASEPVKLDDEQMQSLASMVAAQMIKAQTPEEPEKPEVTPDPPKAPEKEQPSADDLADKILAKLQSSTDVENKKVFDMMWKDKYNQSVSSTPGLEDFINGDDDYGFVRKEKLEAIEDLNERVAALNKLTNSFREASAGNANRRPVVNKKAQQKAKEAETEYEKLDQKMQNGEYTNTAQMTNDFFAAFAKEVEGLT